MMFSSAQSQKSPSVVSSVDLNRYKGLWYEIARLPNFFERKLKCASATYTLRDDGRITVFCCFSIRDLVEKKDQSDHDYACGPDPERFWKIGLREFCWQTSTHSENVSILNLQRSLPERQSWNNVFWWQTWETERTLSMDEFESTNKPIDVLSDRDLMAQIKKGKVKNTKSRDFEEVAKELGI